MRVCLFAVLCLQVQAARMDARLESNEKWFWKADEQKEEEELVEEIKKEGICGSGTIAEELAQGNTVESIRGIPWNAIFKTSQQFIKYRQQDADTLQDSINDMKRDLSKLIRQRDETKVDAMTVEQIQGLITPVVTSTFGSVEDAQKKLCWDGSTKSIDDATQMFDDALAVEMEKARTDVTAVQDACLALMIAKKHDVNMCTEMCNGMGVSAARVSQASKRVKAFNSLEERIEQLDVQVHAKFSQLNYVHQIIEDCQADQEVLQGHKDQLDGLNKVINTEKINIFKTRHELMGAHTSIQSMTVDNDKLNIKVKQLHDSLQKQGALKGDIADTIRQLGVSEAQLVKDIQQQGDLVVKLDGEVKAAGSASEAVIEFKEGLQRVLLIWTTYYMKSVIEPLSQVESLFPNSTFPEIAELKEKSDAAAAGLSDFCKQDTTKVALSSVSKLPELPLICDDQLNTWEVLVGKLGDHVSRVQGESMGFVNELATNLSTVEKKYAYAGPKLTGVRGEVEGVWSMRAFFYDTEFYKSYLKGWKAIDPRMVARLRAKGWKGSVDDIFDGKWMRMCEKLDDAFEDAKLVFADANKDMDNIKQEYDEILAEIAKLEEELDTAEAAHVLNKDMHRTALEELEAMKSAVTDLENRAIELRQQHGVSLDALKAAEEAYVTTHSARKSR